MLRGIEKKNNKHKHKTKKIKTEEKCKAVSTIYKTETNSGCIVLYISVVNRLAAVLWLRHHD